MQEKMKSEQDIKVIANMRKNNRAITLIALVITIILLLILAGVTIAMLTGENGILNKATTSKQKTEEATAEERVKLEVAGSLREDGKLDIDEINDNLRNNVDGLTYNGKAITEKGVADENRIGSLPATVMVDGYEIMINANGSASTIIRMAEYQSDDTKPYLPGNDFSQVSGTTLDNGLVVTDGTNYWTWVEVPKTAVFKTATSETDYENIEKDLETYTTTGQFDDEGSLNLSRNGYTDQWYDYFGASYDGSSAYSQVRFRNETKFNEAKTYYGAIYSNSTGATPAESFGSYSTIYYVKIDDKLDDNRGCGLKYSEYNSLKETMLRSVYRNGGFWIGQYEAGSDGVVRKSNSELTIPVIKEGAYPYNYITCSDAQIQSSKINSGNYTSSLMFGIQWDLVLKHLQVRGKMSVDELTDDSSDWGNYWNTGFDITRGEYSPNYGASFIPVQTGYTKIKISSVLLTTGITERNSRMNIYDIAGNENEWTLEKLTNATCIYRGGYFSDNGSNGPASYRGGASSTTDSNNSISFRPALY